MSVNRTTVVLVVLAVWGALATTAALVAVYGWQNQPRIEAPTVSAARPTGLACENAPAIQPDTSLEYNIVGLNGAKVEAEVLIPKLPGKPTSIALHPDGSVYVAITYGEEYPIQVPRDMVGSVFQVMNGEAHLLLDGLHHPQGLLFVDNTLYVSQFGEVLKLTDVQGTSCDEVSVLIGNLPFDESHSTNGMAFRDGRVYIAQGNPKHANENTRKDLAGTIFSITPEGADVQVEASGFRNPYDLAFDSHGQLWTSDNGPNIGYEEDVTSEAQITQDEIIRVEKGGNYGYPCPVEETCGLPAAMLLEKHSVPTGMTPYKDGLLISSFAMWQTRLIDPATNTYSAFYWDVSFPVDTAMGTDGYIYVAEWDPGRILRVKPPV